LEWTEPVRLTLTVGEVVVASKALNKAANDEAQRGERTSLADTAGRLRQMSETLLNKNLQITFDPECVALAEEYLFSAHQEARDTGSPDELLLCSVLARINEQRPRRT
jgi:hypothetical protein